MKKDPAKKVVPYLLVMTIVLMEAGCGAYKPSPPDESKLKALEEKIEAVERRMDDLHSRVTVIQFMVDNHERTLHEIDKRQKTAKAPKNQLSVPEPPVSPPPASLKQPSQSISPSSPKPFVPAPEDLYHLALKSYEENHYLKAIGLFEKFTEQYPSHGLAGNVYYWQGECHYTQKEYQRAIKSFRKVIADYPTSRKVPDALLKTAYAYISMDDFDNARKYLKEVIKTYPFTRIGTMAEEKLKEIN